MEKITLQKALCLLLLTIYHSDNQVKTIEMGRICSTYGERRGAYRALVGKPEGMGPLERPKHRWENTIKMDLGELRSIRLGTGTGSGLL